MNNVNALTGGNRQAMVMEGLRMFGLPTFDDRLTFGYFTGRVHYIQAKWRAHWRRRLTTAYRLLRRALPIEMVENIMRLRLGRPE